MKYEYQLTEEFIPTFIGEVVYKHQTEYQHALILKTEEFGNILFLDEITQLSDKDEHIYHENMIHPAMLAHSNPKKVLVIGGGDGGSLREIFKYPVEKVVHIELDPEVVRISKEYFPNVSNGAFDDKRLELTFQDGRKYIEETKETFDVIFLDLTEPVGPSKKLFTKEFYTLVKKRLNENGIVVLDNDMIECKGILPVLTKTVETVFAHVYPYTIAIPSYVVRQGFAVCSDKNLDFMRDVKHVEEQIKKYKLDIHYNAWEIASRYNLTKEIEDILAKTTQISTDDKPVEIYYIDEDRERIENQRS